jgi:hypothetical protein
LNIETSALRRGAWWSSSSAALMRSVCASRSSRSSATMASARAHVVLGDLQGRALGALAAEFGERLDDLPVRNYCVEGEMCLD